MIYKSNINYLNLYPNLPLILLTANFSLTDLPIRFLDLLKRLTKKILGKRQIKLVIIPIDI